MTSEMIYIGVTNCRKTTEAKGLTGYTDDTDRYIERDGFRERERERS